MNTWQKVLDIINKVQGTNIEMGEEFDIENNSYNPFKMTEEGLVDCDGDLAILGIHHLISGIESIIKKPKKWKPKLDEYYFTPFLANSTLYAKCIWVDNGIDNFRLDNNLVCRTEEETIEKAKLMLKAIESEGK